MQTTGQLRLTPLRRACEVAVLVGVGLMLVHTWLVSRHVIATGSMAPTLVAGDRVLVARSVFDFRSPQRWEIVAFRLPLADASFAVKRVVGLPGERVQFVDGKLFVDGRELKTPHDTAYHRPATLYESVGFDAPYQLSADEYFVLGDDAEVSVDSRYLGFGPAVHANLLVGKPFFRYASTTSWQVGAFDFQVPEFRRIGYIP